jgi:hypothetical protein
MIAAGLCWYQEPPELLKRCIGSLAPFIDHLVAVDGAWSLWENATASSTPEEHDTIRRACEKAGITCEIVVPGEPWGTQAEKRNAAIRKAATAADWAMPLDADWTFEGDPQAFRHELDNTTGDSGLVAFYTPPGGDNVDLFHDWHRETADTTDMKELVYRTLPGLRCEDRHWFYSALKDGERVGLWGCPDYPPADRFAVNEFRIVHRCFERDPDRVRANTDYINRRSILLAAAPSDRYEP